MIGQFIKCGINTGLETRTLTRFFGTKGCQKGIAERIAAKQPVQIAPQNMAIRTNRPIRRAIQIKPTAVPIRAISLAHMDFVAINSNSSGKSNVIADRQTGCFAKRLVTGHDGFNIQKTQPGLTARCAFHPVWVMNIRPSI